MSAQAPSALAVANNTASVMQHATFSAVQLGNFPLQSCDVQCAFDNWILDLQRNAAAYPKIHARHMDYLEELVNEVRKNLTKLGYEF